MKSNFLLSLIKSFIIGDDKNFKRGQEAFFNNKRFVPRNIESHWELAL